MATVEVRRLSKSTRGTVALQALSFAVEDGEFFCLLGPPGAGKTTAFRLISGLDQPDQGQVLIGGEVVNDVPPQRRDVAMVFEDMALYPHMTAFGNIAHSLYLRRLGESQIRERVQSVAEQLRISHLLDRRPDTYSGGERRRVALARAIVRSPRALLLDQALSDLDAKIRQEMAGELKRLQRETGQTMIYATHDYEEAIAMGDRILAIRQGAEVQTAGPEEIYWKPKTSFVASLVGSPPINLLPCQVSVEDGQPRAQHPGFGVRLPKGRQLPQRILLGIRPEHVEVVGEGHPDAIWAEVDIIQVLGDERIVDFRLSDGSQIRFFGSVDQGWESGDQVALKLPTEWIYAFDPETELRLLGPEWMSGG